MATKHTAQRHASALITCSGESQAQDHPARSRRHGHHLSYRLAASFLKNPRIQVNPLCRAAYVAYFTASRPLRGGITCKFLNTIFKERLWEKPWLTGESRAKSPRQSQVFSQGIYFRPDGNLGGHTEASSDHLVRLGHLQGSTAKPSQVKPYSPGGKAHEPNRIVLSISRTMLPSIGRSFPCVSRVAGPAPVAMMKWLAVTSSVPCVTFRAFGWTSETESKPDRAQWIRSWLYATLSQVAPLLDNKPCSNQPNLVTP